MKTRLPLLLCLALLTMAPCAAAQPPTDTPPPSLGEADRIRLAEAFRLAGALGDTLWSGWGRAPFAVLLVTPEHEFLLRHPSPPADFARVGYDPLLATEVHVRPRTFDPRLAASFPFAGTPTVVIGEPGGRKEGSTAWVVTLLHEHFHQLQSSRPDYFAGVEALELAGDDRTGMWMLNYPFPYDSAIVQQRFAELALALATALDADDADLPSGVDGVRVAQRRFRESLPERDHRYFAFQLWQEGVARYTELALARLAAERYAPSPAFRALPDYTPFQEHARALHDGVLAPLHAPELSRERRVAFYPLGAATALLLDRAAPGWKDRYFSEPFSLEYFPVP